MNTRKRLLVGSIAISVAAMQSLTASGQRSMEFLDRHAQGDWGEVLSNEERQANEEAVLQGLAVVSAFVLRNNDTLWIVTEAGHTLTRLALEREL